MNPTIHPQILIVYDSAYGNTQKIAEAMARAMPGQANAVHLSKVHRSDLNSLDLLIVGSPTQGGRPTPVLQGFLDQLPANSLANTRVAAFDTRFAIRDHGFGLRVLMKTIGFAAGRIAKSLKSKGGHLVAPPEGFIVKDKAGPLKPGETERAATWAKTFAPGEITRAVYNH
jgi:flavodoxin I